MPIEKNTEYGTHKEVTICLFGYGDIGVSVGKTEDSTLPNVIALHQVEARPLLDVEEYPEKITTDQIKKLGVIMHFQKPESITTLVQALLEIQRNLFLEQQNAKL